MNTDNISYPQPEKAYKNPVFLDSGAARYVRILSEFLDPEARFRKHGITGAVVFFGSARIRPSSHSSSSKKSLADVSLAQYYDDAEALSYRLTQWLKRHSHQGKQQCVVCSGGGPGIMEAANKGASRARGISMGFNISTPFEQHANPYQTPELSFLFHYFFVRKFWFAYLAKALVVFPGGFGTMDELFEIITLTQTCKTPILPIVLYGGDYWNTVVNFDAMEKYGVIRREERELFVICDTVDAAFRHITRTIKIMDTLQR